MRFFLFFIQFCLLTACNSTKNTIKNKQKAFQNTSHKNIKIFESNGKGLGPCEPSIFINPTNPDNIVVGSIINFYHISNDGGKSWQTDTLTSSLGVWGDPCIVADHKGNFYYFHLSDPEGTNWASQHVLDQIVVQRSSNGGNTWNNGSGIGKNPPKQQDKEWAAVHPTTGQLYITWTEFDSYGNTSPNCHSRIMFSTSTDLGETWSKAISINQFNGNCIDDDKTTEGAVPAVDNKGNIYVAWSYNNAIYFDKSTDGGKTWLNNDIIISQQQAGWTQEIPGLGRSNGMPVTCVDNSQEKHQGTIYVNWTDQRNGNNNTDVFISKSTDGGKTWTNAKKINNDTTQTHQFLTWMTVDPITGYVYVVFYDRQRYTDYKTDVTLAVSYDGGNTFTQKIISENPFTPTTNVFFGDYNNINAYDGMIRPVWTHLQNNKLSIWTALIEDR